MRTSVNYEVTCVVDNGINRLMEEWRVSIHELSADGKDVLHCERATDRDFNYDNMLPDGLCRRRNTRYFFLAVVVVFLLFLPISAQAFPTGKDSSFITTGGLDRQQCEQGIVNIVASL